MDQWDYVIAAYVVGIGGTILVTLLSWLRLKRTEKRLEELKRS